MSDSNPHKIENPHGMIMSKDGKTSFVKATKAYDNSEFLHSRSARHVRIMCEYLETQTRLRQEGVLATILVFGSARGYSPEDWETEMKCKQEELKNAKTDDERETAEASIKRMNQLKWMSSYYHKVEDLSKRLTEWGQTPEGHHYIGRILKTIPSPVTADGYNQHDIDFVENEKGPGALVICTGGGPGLMEAANKGARSAPNGRTAGMGVSLPFEPGLNRYVNPELAFRFHYFFTRKFWMVYCCMGLVVCPGGLGTMDELLEILTLKQTGKFRRDIPIVLMGKDYWRKAINFEFLVECGTIAAKDIQNLLYTDDVDEAYNFIIKELQSEKLIIPHKSVKSFDLRT